jgi:hypothetical protein
MVSATVDTIGGNLSYDVAPSNIQAIRIHASSTGTLQSISVNLEAAGNTSMAIYSGTGSNPSSLLGNATGIYGSIGWNDFNIPGISIVAGNYYWLAVQTQGNRYNAGFTGIDTYAQQSYNYSSSNAWPDISSWPVYSASPYGVNMRMTYNGTNPITNCTFEGGTPTLNYTLVNENSLLPIYGNIQMTHNFGNGSSYSFIYNNQSSFANCINPYSAIYSDYDAPIQYVDTQGAYTTRYFWLDNYTLTNSSKQINLYLLNTSAGSPVQITLRDTQGNLITNGYLQICRFYPATNTCGIVEVLPLSAQGTAIAFLQLYTAYYQFQYTSYGVVYGTIPKQFISSTAFTLSLPSNPVSPFLIYYNSLGGNVTYDPTTGNITAFYTDTSGDLTNATFVVNQIGALQTANICTITNTSLPSGEMVCYIGNATGNLYSETLSGGTTDGNTFIMVNKVLQYPPSTSLLFGSCTGTGFALCQEGAIITFFILIVCAFMGLYSPTAAIIMTSIGLGASIFMGLFVVNVATFVGLIVIAAIIIFKLRGGSNA